MADVAHRQSSRGIKSGSLSDRNPKSQSAVDAGVHVCEQLGIGLLKLKHVVHFTYAVNGTAVVVVAVSVGATANTATVKETTKPSSTPGPLSSELVSLPLFTQSSQYLIPHHPTSR
jgi:hypothetical protein